MVTLNKKNSSSQFTSTYNFTIFLTIHLKILLWRFVGTLQKKIQEIRAYFVNICKWFLHKWPRNEEANTLVNRLRYHWHLILTYFCYVLTLSSTKAELYAFFLWINAANFYAVLQTINKFVPLYLEQKYLHNFAPLNVHNVRSDMDSLVHDHGLLKDKA